VGSCFGRRKIYHPTLKHYYNNQCGPPPCNFFTHQPHPAQSIVEAVTIRHPISWPPELPTNRYKYTIFVNHPPLSPVVVQSSTHPRNSYPIESPPSVNYPTATPSPWAIPREIATSSTCAKCIPGTPTTNPTKRPRKKLDWVASSDRADRYDNWPCTPPCRIWRVLVWIASCGRGM